MNSKEFYLDGNKLLITPAELDDAGGLRDAVIECAKGLKIEPKMLETDINVIKEFLISASTSDNVKKYLFKCMLRATFNDLRITKDLFDDPKIGGSLRENYYEIVWHIFEVNCLPFFQKPLSLLKTRIEELMKQQALKNIPESK